MKTLFIAGNENSGKTTTFGKLRKALTNKKNGNYEILEIEENEMYDSEVQQHDYIILLKEKNRDSNIRVILNYAADNQTIINKFQSKLCEWKDNKKISLSNTIVITAARDKNDEMRKLLEKTIKKIQLDFKEPDNFAELPLARINGNANDSLLKWYLEAILKIVIHILSKKPFNLRIESK